MKYSLSLLLLLASSAVAYADARIEVGPNGYNNKGDNFAHYPYDENDTDNEMYVPGKARVVQYDGGASAYGKASFVVSDIDAYAVNMMVPAGRCKVVSSENTGETCTIEANGTTYVSNDWEVSVCKIWTTRVSGKIVCHNGVAQ